MDTPTQCRQDQRVPAGRRSASSLRASRGLTSCRGRKSTRFRRRGLLRSTNAPLEYNGTHRPTTMARWQPRPRLYSPDKELPLAIVGRPLPRPNIFLSRDRRPQPETTAPALNASSVRAGCGLLPASQPPASTLGPLVSLSGVDWAEPAGAKVQGANMVD
jgi:hypothetical protein